MNKSVSRAFHWQALNPATAVATTVVLALLLALVTEVVINLLPTGGVALRAGTLAVAGLTQRWQSTSASAGLDTLAMVYLWAVFVAVVGLAFAEVKRRVENGPHPVWSNTSAPGRITMGFLLLNSLVAALYLGLVIKGQRADFLFIGQEVTGLLLNGFLASGVIIYATVWVALDVESDFDHAMHAVATLSAVPAIILALTSHTVANLGNMVGLLVCECMLLRLTRADEAYFIKFRPRQD